MAGTFSMIVSRKLGAVQRSFGLEAVGDVLGDQHQKLRLPLLVADHDPFGAHLARAGSTGMGRRPIGRQAVGSPEGIFVMRR